MYSSYLTSYSFSLELWLIIIMSCYYLIITYTCIAVEYNCMYMQTIILDTVQLCICNIKACGHVSVAKKDVWYVSVLFIGTANSSFSTPCIFITTVLICAYVHILCSPCTQPHIPNLKKIYLIIHKVFVPENCPVFFTFFFFFAPFQKTNFESTEDNLLVN